MTNPAVGFIGLGDLGLPMARKVLQAGFGLTVFDIRQEAMAQIVGLGAHAAQSIGDLAAASEIIAIMVLNGRQVEDVCLGAQGIVASAPEGAIIVVHSTVGADICATIADAASRRGIHVLDAGVSGGALKADTASLSVLVGGPRHVVESCEPYFRCFASDIFHVGERVGSGQIAKILNNHAYFCNLFILRETMRLSRAAGIADEAILDILNASTGGSVASQTWRHMESFRQSYTTGPDGVDQVMSKDLSLSLQLAHSLEVEAPAGAAIARAHDLRAEAG